MVVKLSWHKAISFVCLAVNVTLGSCQTQHRDLPSWAQGDWNAKDNAYRKILDDVRPFFGKNGFIDKDVVSNKWKESYFQYRSDQSNSIKLMRILAWTEVAMSDNNIFADPELKKLKREFIATYQYWSKPIDSFSFVRTFAMVQFMTSSPDAFVENRLLETLYVHNPRDPDLELFYIVWCSMNHGVAPNRLTLMKLLAKQEKIEFRKYGRIKLIELAYLNISAYEGRSPEILEHVIALRDKRMSVLPKDHPDNSPESRKSLKESNDSIQKTIKRWRDVGGRT